MDKQETQFKTVRWLIRRCQRLCDWILARERSTYVFAAVAVSVICVVPLFDSPRYTLYSRYADHMHHAYASWALLNIGPAVFTTPIGEWSFGALRPYVSWPTLPYLYPLGSLVLFLPFGVLNNLGVLPESLINMAIIMLFGVGGVVATWLLYRTLSNSYDPKVVIMVVLTAGPLYVFWGLNGFFDTIAVAAAFYGIRAYWRDDDGTALLALVGALSLHYRLWYLGPLALVVAARYWWSLDGMLDWRLVLAGVLGGGSLLSFGLTIPGLMALDDAPMFRANQISLTTGVAPATLFALCGAVVLLAVVYTHESNPATVAALTLAVVSIFTLTQWFAWYPILLTPTLALVDSRPSRLALVCGFYPVILLLGNTADVIVVIWTVVQAILGGG